MLATQGLKRKKDPGQEATMWTDAGKAWAA